MHASKPFWQNPCGIFDKNGVRDETDYRNIDIEGTIEHAAWAASIAKKQASDLKIFMEDKYPSIDPDSIPNYDFLSIPETDVNDIDVTTLHAIYNLIQKYGVALEQILLESEESIERGSGDEWEADYKEHLISKKSRMIQLLCPLQLLLRTSGEIEKDVTRSIMPEDLKCLKGSRRIIRDINVIKSYTCAIEFVESVLKNYKSF